MTIFAIRLDGGRPAFLTVQTIKNQRTYSIQGIPPGVYEVLAAGSFALPPQHFAGAYTRFAISDILCREVVTCTWTIPSSP